MSSRDTKNEPTSQAAQGLDRTEPTTPDPEDPRKPDDVGDLDKRTWSYVARKVWREFSDDQCTDLAAALTYYGVLAIFPAVLALSAILGLVGQSETSVQTVLDVIRPLVSESALGTIEPTLIELASSKTAGLALVLGLLGALWSASGYVGAFGRAMNRIYSIDEGRPVWKLRPTQLLVTVIVVILVVLGALILVSGPIVDQVASVIGIGDVAVTVFQIVKWPILVVIAIAAIAILYYFSPNVRQPKFKWTSTGSLLALVVWALATVALGLYLSLSGGGSYAKTYGAVAGVIVFLLWLWITNLVLLFGAEFDAELERSRELQAGIAAEEQIQLPPRDTRQSDKKAAKHEKDVAQGRALRESRGTSDD